jgi:mono/diheme cytochrome c family protein
MPKRIDIFISYAREDVLRIKPLAEWLESHGWSLWWDEKIQPGKRFPKVIEEALDEARCVIVVWSKTSISSDWVQTEAAEGLRREVLIPVILDENLRIPLQFRQLQTVNLTESLSHQSLQQLDQAITGLIGTLPGTESIPSRAQQTHQVHRSGTAENKASTGNTARHNEKDQSSRSAEIKGSDVTQTGEKKSLLSFVVQIWLLQEFWPKLLYFVVFVVLAILPIILIMSSDEGEGPIVPPPPPPAEYADKHMPAGWWNDEKIIEEGRQIFIGAKNIDVNCASCHGKDGKPVKAGARDFRVTDRMKLYSDSVWFWRISEGVPNTKMKPWKSKLPEEDRWKVIAYERTFGLKGQEWNQAMEKWVPIGVANPKN